LVDVALWWKKNGKNHRLIERVAARELACPDSNALQERVFSLCKLIDSPLRQNLGNAKFEMLLVLSFNKDFIRSAESGSLLTTSGLVKALESAASAKEAAATLIDFFDLDSNMDNDQTDDGIDIAELLRSAATAAESKKQRAKKRRATDMYYSVPQYSHVWTLRAAQKSSIWSCMEVEPPIKSCECALQVPTACHVVPERQTSHFRPQESAQHSTR
jgi:hypothetical protein